MALALLLVSLGPACQARAEQPVYRCTTGARVLYTDTPCTNGERITIEPGKPAADAREQLQRDQQALDAWTRQRNAEQAREDALQRAQAAHERLLADEAAAMPPDSGYGPAYGTYGYVGGWGGIDIRPRHHPVQRRHDRAHASRRFILVPPPVAHFGSRR